MISWLWIIGVVFCCSKMRWLRKRISWLGVSGSRGVCCSWSREGMSRFETSVWAWADKTWSLCCLLLDEWPTWVKQNRYSPQMSNAETSAPVGVPVAEWEECCRDWWYCRWEQQLNVELGGVDEQSWVSICQRSLRNTLALAFGVIYIFVTQIHI